MTSEKIIVLVSDKGDIQHGEISVLDDPKKAERLVETLLEAGFEQERIRVFSGKASEFEISHRPVVALVGESEEGAAATAAEADGGETQADEPAVEPPVEVEATQTDAKGDAKGEAEQEPAEEGEVPTTAEAATPVKFSSLFRSA